MKVQSLLAAAALALEGVSAHPHSHSALHKLRLRDILQKKDQALDNALKSVNWCQVFPNGIGCDGTTPVGQKAASEPAPATPAPASTGSSQSAGGGPGSCLDLTKLFTKRATTQQDSYMGNSNNNIHPEPNCQSSKPYSLTFVNNMGSKQTFWLWNKAGTGGPNAPNGMMIPASKIFDLEAGQKATFSFDANSLVGFSNACGRATANGGVPNCNIGEASFADGNTWGGSNGGSFYDVSMVPVTMIGGSAKKIPMSISADGQSTSSNTQCNYVQPTDNSPQNPPAGGACNCGTQKAADPFHPTVTFG